MELISSKLTLELCQLIADHSSSIMRSLFFDTPPVQYSDIGGEASTIQKLHEAVKWPLLYPKTCTRLGM